MMYNKVITYENVPDDDKKIAFFFYGGFLSTSA